jgi:hypothetical protein
LKILLPKRRALLFAAPVAEQLSSIETCVAASRLRIHFPIDGYASHMPGVLAATKRHAKSWVVKRPASSQPALQRQHTAAREMSRHRSFYGLNEGVDYRLMMVVCLLSNISFAYFATETGEFTPATASVRHLHAPRFATPR